MNRVVERVGEAGNREEVHKVKNSGPLQDRSQSLASKEKQRNEERDRDIEHCVHTCVDGGNGCLLLSRELLFVGVQVLGEESAIDKEADEKDASGDAVEGAPSGFVEDSDHGQGYH